MTLSAHLINLMSIRQKQGFELSESESSQIPIDGKSFAEALEDSLSRAPHKADGVGLAQIASQYETNPNAAADALVDRRPLAEAGATISPARLVEKFVNEQDLALAAQRSPESRYRVLPSDDASGESGVRANLRPIE